MSATATLPLLGRFPLLFPTLGAVSGILAAEYRLWPLLILLVVAGIYQGLWRQTPSLTIGSLLALTLALSHHHRLQKREELASLLANERELILVGTLTETNSAGLVRRLFRTEEGARLVLLNLPNHFQTGQKLRITGEPIQKHQARNPSGWNPDQTLWKRGIAGTFVITRAQQTGWAHGFPVLRGWSESIRKELAHRVTSGVDDRASADILQAVVLGEKASGSRAFDDFRKTGTMHVFAVSGLHVGLVALITFGVGRLFRIPPRVLLWGMVFAMLGYAFVTGLRPPALRASLMGTLLLGRFLLLRRPSVVNNLFAAALVVLSFDSFQLWQAGFQLSFFVVGIILLLEPHFWKKAEPCLAHDPYLPEAVWTPWQRLTHWARNKVGKMFTVSLSAWIGSAPLSLLYFGWFTPIAALSSVLMVMIAFLILSIAFLGLALGTVSPSTSKVLNKANSLLATFASSSAATMGEWPGAWTRVHPNAEWKDGLCVFDIRYGGGAIHLDAGGGTLIDAGGTFSFWWEVEPALQAHNLTFDSIIATHNDSQHIGGLRAATQSFPVKQALIPFEEKRFSLQSLIATCREKKVQLHSAEPQLQLPIDEDTWIEILSHGNPTTSRADDRGLVLLIHQRGWRILITADAGYETEKELLESGQNLQAHVWICGRHQQDSMGQDQFIRAISPQIIIATDQSYPATEKVPLKWREWLESEGIAFYSHREQGAVFVVPQKQKLTVTSFLTDKKTTLKR